MDLVIFVNFNAISIDFYAVKCIICIYFHVYKRENAYIRDLYALTILMDFLCIYLGEEGGGVGALMHVHVWEHIVSLSSRTAS